MSRVKIGVLQFPGLNCEDETLRVLEFAGCEGALIRWNEPASKLSECAGFIIPGGFSYQDRVRAGAIASKSLCSDCMAWPWPEASVRRTSPSPSRSLRSPAAGSSACWRSSSLVASGRASSWPRRFSLSSPHRPLLWSWS